MTAMSWTNWFGHAAAAALVATAMGCAPPPDAVEAQRMTTTKLLKATPAAELPASDTKAFQDALGGVPIDIDRWAGYVAGTDGGALLLLHLSGAHGSKAVAGLSIAFVEDPGGAATGNLDARLRDAARLEVRFNDGTGIVSTHTFGRSPSTNAAHRANANADTLLKRAFSDAEALLRAPQSIIESSDAEKACVANFLMTVSNAARCVDDPANVVECGAVRGNAMDTASACQGTKTANILASTNPNVLQTRAQSTSGLATLGTIIKLLGVFSSLSKPGAGAGGGGAGSLLGILGGLVGGGGGGGGASILPTLIKFLPKLFGNPTGVQASPLNGAVSLGNLGGRGGDDDDDDNDN
jgi:hypothetical protein